MTTNRYGNLVDMEVIKNDKDKPSLDLIPPEVIFALGKVLSYGIEKHSRRDWEVKPANWGKHFAALQRHLWEWWSGNSIDPETGDSHLNNAIARLSFLLAYESRSIGKDDRPNKRVES